MTPPSSICLLVRGRNVSKGDFIRIVFIGLHIIITMLCCRVLEVTTCIELHRRGRAIR